AERARRALDARGPAVLRVSGASAAELTERLQVVDRDGRTAEDLVLGIARLHAGEVEERVEQGGGMSRRQDEAVAVRPDRIVRIEAQEALPQAVHDGRHAHGRARMTR